MEFRGRDRELEVLDDLWSRQTAALAILYGRRRVGKTRLLTHWAKARDYERVLYWVAEPTSTQDQLRALSQELYRFAFPSTPPPADFTYASWGQVWEQVAHLSETKRLALFLDEFTYLIASDPAIAGSLQNHWDHLLKERNLLLVLSGSHLGMMQRQVLSYQAPLYGRATAQIDMQPLPFGITKSYFPKYAAHERVAIYAMFGGVPAYWERLDQSASISTNIRQQLLTPSNLMQDEPRLLLHDFIADTPNYISILRAIAADCRRQKEISGRTGLAQGHVSKYLHSLQEAGFVERRVPVTEQEQSRKGRYHITDPYIRFYYRFLANRQSQLAKGIQDQALKEIKNHLVDFIGRHTWEELCRDWLLHAGAHDQSPWLPDRIGSAWTKNAQVDVVGINRMEKTLILGECKWSPRRSGIGVIRDLMAKTKEIVPDQGSWRVHYYGFARGGWSLDAQAYLPPKLPSDANWSVEGTSFLSLQQIDDDLCNWEC